MLNAFVESFNGRLRDELLNETLFTLLAQARVEFGPPRSLALRYANGSAPTPVAPTAPTGNPNARSELRTG
ncbi:hypothetical protein V1291_000815 [Nitrobacteraceae bacterium AZCC 1564]